MNTNINSIWAVLELVEEEGGYVRFWALDSIFTTRKKAVEALDDGYYDFDITTSGDDSVYVYDDGEVIDLEEGWAITSIDVDAGLLNVRGGVEPKHYGELLKLGIAK